MKYIPQSVWKVDQKVSMKQKQAHFNCKFSTAQSVPLIAVRFVCIALLSTVYIYIHVHVHVPLDIFTFDNEKVWPRWRRPFMYG